VQLVEVDAVELQSPQRRLAALLDPLGAEVARPLAGARADKASLRRDHEVVGIRMQRLRNQVLRDLGPVGVGGVDQVHAELEAALEDADGLVGIGRRTPGAGAGDAIAP